MLELQKPSQAEGFWTPCQKYVFLLARAKNPHRQRVFEHTYMLRAGLLVRRKSFPFDVCMSENHVFYRQNETYIHAQQPAVFTK